MTIGALKRLAFNLRHILQPEGSSSILGAEHVTDITDGVEELVECPCSDLAQMRLELGKRHL